VPALASATAGAGTDAVGQAGAAPVADPAAGAALRVADPAAAPPPPAAAPAAAEVPPQGQESAEPVLISLDDLADLVEAGQELNVKVERLVEAQKLQVRNEAQGREGKCGLLPTRGWTAAKLLPHCSPSLLAFS
jgi:hypothetical protein